MQSIGGLGPVINNTNSKNRRSHKTAEPINSLSKVLHVWSCMCESPPKTQPSIIYTKGQQASHTVRSSFRDLAQIRLVEGGIFPGH